MFNSTFRTTARLLIILVGSAGIAGAASISSFCTPNVGMGTIAIINGGNGSASLTCPGVAAPAGSLIGRITLALTAGYQFGSSSSNSVDVTFAGSVNAPFTQTVTVTGGLGSNNTAQGIQFTPAGGLASVSDFSVLVTSAVTAGAVASSSATVIVRYCLDEPACAIMPTGGTTGNWTLSGPSGSWFDPPFTSSYDYNGIGGTTFTQIGLVTGFGPVNVLYGPGFGISLGSFAGGSMVDFVALTGAALSSFRISGINPTVDAADPSAYPIQAFFSTSTGSFTQTAVPEPATWSLMLVGTLLAAYRKGIFEKRGHRRKNGATVGRGGPVSK